MLARLCENSKVLGEVDIIHMQDIFFRILVIIMNVVSIIFAIFVFFLIY